MGYTSEKLEAIAAKLKTMPAIEKKKQQHSKQEAIKVLAKEIVALQKRGYTLEQIAETLRGEGLAISTPTLKSYLQRIKVGKNKVQSGAKKDTQKSPPARITLEDKQQVDGLGTLANASFTPKPDTDDI